MRRPGTAPGGRVAAQVGEQGDSRSGLRLLRSGISRRAFLERAGLTGAAAILAQIPGFLAKQGWLEAALAAENDLTRDTLNGLVAFVVPGPDAYSKAQGQSSKRPGGIQAGTTPALIELLDRFVGTSENAIRIQIAVALIAFLLLRMAQAAQKHIQSPIVFARLVRANLMHRRQIDYLLTPAPPTVQDQRQMSLHLC